MIYYLGIEDGLHVHTAVCDGSIRSVKFHVRNTICDTAQRQSLMYVVYDFSVFGYSSFYQSGETEFLQVVKAQLGSDDGKGFNRNDVKRLLYGITYGAGAFISTCTVPVFNRTAGVIVKGLIYKYISKCDAG